MCFKRCFPLRSIRFAVWWLTLQWAVTVFAGPHDWISNDRLVTRPVEKVRMFTLEGIWACVLSLVMFFFFPVQYHEESLGIHRDHHRELAERGHQRLSRIQALQPKRHAERQRNESGNGNEMKENVNDREENGKNGKNSENGNGKKNNARNNRSENGSGNASENENERKRNDEKWNDERWKGNECCSSSNGNRKQPLQRLVRILWCETVLH